LLAAGLTIPAASKAALWVINLVNGFISKRGRRQAVLHAAPGFLSSA
jgi:hypothetical protein